jgi:hypothetical protein
VAAKARAARVHARRRAVVRKARHARRTMRLSINRIICRTTSANRAITATATALRKPTRLRICVLKRSRVAAMGSRIRCARASTTWVVDVGAVVRVAAVAATVATGRAAVAVRVVAAVVVTAAVAVIGPAAAVVAGRSVVERCG